MAEVKDYLKDVEGGTRRYIPAEARYLRVEGEDGEAPRHVIEGVAIYVGERTNLGWFDEVIEPGAFDEVLTDPDTDCRALFNHDPNLILARFSKNHDTLDLFKTEEGHLGYRYTTPNRSYALDLQDSIISRDVDQCSFGFTIKEDSWQWAEAGTKENDLRKVIKIGRLLDVSPVTYPAYKSTTVMVEEEAQRSMKAAKKEQTQGSAKPLARNRYKPLIDSL